MRLTLGENTHKKGTLRGGSKTVLTTKQKTTFSLWFKKSIRKINKKKLYVMFSAGLYRSTEKDYQEFLPSNWKYYILKFKSDRKLFINSLSILDHFQAIKICNKNGFEPPRSGGGYPDLSGSFIKEKLFFLCVFP